jgi:hypothetical protein
MMPIRALALRTLCAAALGLQAVPSAVAAIPALDKVFSSAGHPKADGLSVTLRLPASWVWKEGTRPHVVHSFGEAGTGRNCNLIVRRLPDPVARKDVAATLDDMAIGSELPAGLTLMRKAATTLDGLPAQTVVSSGTVSSGGIEIAAMAAQFATIYRQDFIILTCLSRLAGADDRQRMREDSTLYSLVANSLVIENQWTDRTP